MSSRELLKAIGEIDDRFIEEAAESYSAAKPAARRMRRRRWVTAAACLIIAAGIGVISLPKVFLAGSKASSKSSSFSSDSLPRYIPQAEKAINTMDMMSEELQLTDADGSGYPGSTYLIVTGGSAASSNAHGSLEKPAGMPESNVFRDAPKALWQETVTGR